MLLRRQLLCIENGECSGSNTLAYDAAGNLTTDKDGYHYQYDCENRITKIIKSGPTTVAEFTYDALGRRIEKKDCITSANTRRYYYNDNWQVLCEYNAAGTYLYQWFAYGNYIDEVLMRSQSLSHSSSTLYYYVHDHLYSPVALVQRVNSLALSERYEYDAYGNCYVLEPNFAPDPDNKTDYGNPYYFTGRQLDALDGGNLKIQYNRNRYYDYYTGRWLTHDPAGMANYLLEKLQYFDGMNLYQYVHSNPANARDPLGLWDWDPRDIYYLGTFITHRYYGDGSLWTKGAANLRRQERLKEVTSLELRDLAKRTCQNMRHSGTCSKRGTLNIPLTGPLCTTHGMRASLNGPNPVFRITGSYEAFASRTGMKCYCTVNFRNKYVWFDIADLNYEHLSDQIYRALELAGFFFAHLPWPVDFNIRIRWWDNSRYINVRRPDGTIQNYTAGWPFE